MKEPSPVIGGFVKLSTIDYPGLLAAVIFIRGCNLRCPYCHNKDLVLYDSDSQTIPKTYIYDFLEIRQGSLDAVVISGGEPCHSFGLEDFIFPIKRLGYKVKLDTNGTYPEVMFKLINRQLIDYIALDVKDNPVNYSVSFGPRAITDNVKYAIDTLKRSDILYEFRTTAVRPFITDESIEVIAKNCSGNRPLYLQTLRPESVLNPEFLHSFQGQPGPDQLARFQAIANKYLPTFIR
jgi:pyruvate formate lyase activating enzyme